MKRVKRGKSRDEPPLNTCQHGFVSCSSLLIFHHVHELLLTSAAEPALTVTSQYEFLRPFAGYGLLGMLRAHRRLSPPRIQMQEVW